MKANTDSLINQQLPLKSPSGNLLNTAAKSGVMDAVVTSNSRIAAPTSAGSEQFRINISVGQQKFELITNATIAAGSRLQITIAQNNLATILSLTNPASGSASNSTGAMGRPALHTTGLLVETSSESLKPSALFQGYPSDLAASNTAKPSSTGSSNDRNVDVLLRQLSGQLFANLARTQLNQLETLATRQQNTPENLDPINSWTLEIRIIYGENIDNLDARIDQHLIDEEHNGSNKSGQNLWPTMLAFDQHKIGKMNAQL